MAVRWPRYPLVYEINTRAVAARAVGAAPADGHPGHRSFRGDRPHRRPRLRRGLADGRVGHRARGGLGRAPRRRACARSTTGRSPTAPTADIIGSPYAISRYEVAEEIGGPGGLQVLRARLAAQGIRVILDFVPNHTARDHRLVREQPRRLRQGHARTTWPAIPRSFFRSRDGGDHRPRPRSLLPGLDRHRAGQLREPRGPRRAAADPPAHRRAVRRRALRHGDAACCPTSSRGPGRGAWGRTRSRDSFWKEAIAAVLARHPRFLFIAEAYWGLEDRLHEDGFHFTYDKELYDLLRDARRGRRPARTCAARRRSRTARARFIENHDEPRAVAAFGPLARAAAVDDLLRPGPAPVPRGPARRAGACGCPCSSPAGRRSRWTRSCATFYERLLAVLQQPIFKEGVFQPVDVRQAGPEDHTNDAMVAATWRTRPRERDPHVPRGVQPGGDEGVRAHPARPRAVPGRPAAIASCDHVDGRDYERDGAEIADPGLFIALEPYQAHVFEITRMPTRNNGASGPRRLSRRRDEPGTGRGADGDGRGEPGPGRPARVARRAAAAAGRDLLGDGPRLPPLGRRRRVSERRAPRRRPPSPLDAEATQRVLDRLPPLAPVAGDQQPFAFRERSLPPPRAGATVVQPFPPPSAPPSGPPAVAGEPVTVLRRSPEGRVPLASHLSVTFSQPMVPVGSHDDLAAPGRPGSPDAGAARASGGGWGRARCCSSPRAVSRWRRRIASRCPRACQPASGAPSRQAVQWEFTTPAPTLTVKHPDGVPRAATR